MFEIELRNPDEMSIRLKDRVINVNVAQSTIAAGLAVGTIKGAGEFEIGETTISGVATDLGGVIYRIEIGDVAIGVVGSEVKNEDLDELGPIDILGTSVAGIVGLIEPKIVIPMGNMDFAELKASVKMEKRLKIKNVAALPAIMEIYKLG
ncbi:MBL fold metallo-hydrolase [Candidatus Saccharibacteria bacterium]|nr:MBL fold metallo-hydrolase [Candidatus Saccharibacteria bacterium]